MIALSFSFIESYLSFSECQDSADTDLLIVKRISIRVAVRFFQSWFFAYFACLVSHEQP